MCVCVCVCVCVGQPLSLRVPMFPSRGVEQARAPLNKALCSVLRISARTLADVPAPETVAQAFPLSI